MIIKFNGNLTVRFIDDRYYTYQAVPVHEVKALANAESAGSYYNLRIKNFAYLQADNNNGEPKRQSLMFGPLAYHEEVPPKQWLVGDSYKIETEFGFEHCKKVGTNFLYHRVDGPSRYWEDMLGTCEEYWLNGQRHRIDGPAVLQSVGGVGAP